MNANQNTIFEIGDDLEIKKTTRRAASGGTWVIGTLCGHSFNALVFPVHAECQEYELKDSRISKLWIERLSNHQNVANFDRGWDLQPVDAAAWEIVDFLTAGLADYIYHD